jgi:hypothetical protein
VAEEFLEFENTIEDEEGRSHVALVVGEQREDGRWIGRIRFTLTDGSDSVETDRETTQPNRDALAYWATGLTYFYLEGALARARRRPERKPSGRLASPQPGGVPSPQPAGVPSPQPGGVASPQPGSAASRVPYGVPRLEVATTDPTIVERVLGTRDARPGTAREVLHAGFVVYEGLGGADGASQLFSVQYNSRNAGAMLANWLWSQLHGTGFRVRVDGEAVEMTNDALNDALVR